MSKRKLFLWGTGKIANEVMEGHFMEIYDEYDVLGFIDNDPQKQGKSFFNKIILPPTVLLNTEYDYLVILASCIEEIKGLAIKAYAGNEEKIKDKFFLYQRLLSKRYDGYADVEVKTVLEYINRHGLQIFNYEYTSKYKIDNDNILLYLTEELNLSQHYDKFEYNQI